MRSGMDVGGDDQEEDEGSEAAATGPNDTSLGRVRVHIDAVLQPDSVYREGVHRDLDELRSTISARSNKATMLICGSILEAVVLDVLARRPDKVAPFDKQRKFPDRMSLAELIYIVGKPELLDGRNALLTASATGTASAITNHRDLIHPQREVRERIRV